MLNYVHNFINSLALSVAVESTVVLILCYIFDLLKLKIVNINDSEDVTHANKAKATSLIILAAVGTMCTIPYVWFVFPTLLWDKANYIVMTGESFAFILEALFYRYFARLDWKYAFLFSFIANIVSYAIGKI